MNNIKTYGETTDETEVKERSKCREIVGEIMKFGVNQKQIIQIVYLLSLELENRDEMIRISQACKDVQNDKVTKGSTLIVNN
jgi:hypothetical protein